MSSGPSPEIAVRRSQAGSPLLAATSGEGTIDHALPFQCSIKVLTGNS